jgi:hypothetical protein
MALPGWTSAEQISVIDLPGTAVICFLETVPPAVPGDEQAIRFRKRMD